MRFEIVSISEEEYHRVPWFLSLTLHVRLESLLLVFSNLLGKLKSLSLWFPYHLFHGLVCGFSMEEILAFQRQNKVLERLERLGFEIEIMN